MNIYKKMIGKIGLGIAGLGLLTTVYAGLSYLPKDDCKYAKVYAGKTYGSLTFSKCGEDKIDRVVQEDGIRGLNLSGEKIPADLNQLGLEAIALQEKTIKALDGIKQM